MVGVNPPADIASGRIAEVRSRSTVSYTHLSFSEYEEALRSVGAEVEYYYLCEEDNFQIREDYVDKLSDCLLYTSYQRRDYVSECRGRFVSDRHWYGS